MNTQGVEPAAERLALGPLARGGGVTIVDGLPGVGRTAELLAEAMGLYPGADDQRVLDGDGARGRGGAPPRQLFTSGGGPVQDALYAALWLSDYLSTLCGAPVSPTGGRGSYSYYVRPGDYLGLHLDIDACDVTLITVLRDDSPPGDPAGALLVHPGYRGADLNIVRGDPQGGVGMVKAEPGQSIVLLGGLVPHETVPVGENGPRIISALCFRSG
ncbi:hypothetical protein ACX80E_04860 [Arthrobacter sp. TMN-49]